MKLNRSNIVSGCVGAFMGACAVWGVNTLLGHDESASFSFFTSHKAKQSMFERVETDADGDVYITPRGKKYHRRGCYILKNSDEVKGSSRSSVVKVGYTPCKKCKP